MWGRVCLVHGALCRPLGRFSVYLSVGGLVSAVVEFPCTVLDLDRFHPLYRMYGVFSVGFSD